MFANKTLLSYALGSALYLLSQSAYSAGHSAELESLKRALEAPAEIQPAPKPKRTRAIVFDNEPAAATTENTSSTNRDTIQAPSPSPEAMKSIGSSKQDCKLVSEASGLSAKPIPFSIQFAVGSADVSPSSREVLAGIGSLLQSMLNNRCVLIEGHTDVSGNADRNLELSAARASSVVDFLVQHYSLAPDRVRSFGKGSSEPLPGVDPKNSRNRRVVFKIIG